METLAIVQSRMGSKRLPGKALIKIKNITVIEILLNRLSKTKHVDNIVVATSKQKENDTLSLIVKKKGFNVYRGSESNVLLRFVNIIKKYKPKIIIRITADCPFTDPKLVDRYIKIFKLKKVDYLSNTIQPTYADGFDIEVINPNSILKSYKLDHSKLNQEHVTHFIKNSHKFSKVNIKSKKDYSKFRVTLDTSNDLKIIKKILKEFDYDLNINYQ